MKRTAVQPGDAGPFGARFRDRAWARLEEAPGESSQVEVHEVVSTPAGEEVAR